MEQQEIKEKLEELRKALSNLNGVDSSSDLAGCISLLIVVEMILDTTKNLGTQLPYRVFSSLFGVIRLFSFHFKEDLDVIFKNAGYILDSKQ